MLMRLLSAIVVMVVVWLGCQLLNIITNEIPLNIVQAIGNFIGEWAELIALVAGIWHFVGGGNVFARFGKKDQAA